MIEEDAAYFTEILQLNRLKVDLIERTLFN